ncbi:MAG: copper chaperone PCu(A)C [Hyphomicrobiaceae bacterium]|nr:copper chaperone PCu(A)C [Hyphomicrobiaceae bacterium]
MIPARLLLAAGCLVFGIGAAAAQTAPAADPHAGHMMAPAGSPMAAPANMAGGKATIGEIRIEGGWTRQPPPGAKVSGGFMTITNTGKVADRLVSFTSPIAAKPEVHEMAVTNGVMTMRALDQGLEIPAGGTVVLKPGSFHLMFIDLTAPPTAGGKVPVTLTFEKAGKVELTLDVAPIGAMGLTK